MFVIDPSWSAFAEKNSDLLTWKWEVLNLRRTELLREGKRVFPSNARIFEVLSFVKPEDVRELIVLPHPYNFDSGTGVPCMVETKTKRRTASLMNIQKLFDVCDNDFSEIWKDGILLYNISLTEEEGDFGEKIPHEIFWSQLFEAFLDYLSTNYNNIRFCFTGSTCNKYKKFVNLSNGHSIAELPAITDENFVGKYEAL